jgi:hypothetical protein
MWMCDWGCISDLGIYDVGLGLSRI